MKILLISLSNIGDVILTTSVLEGLWRAHRTPLEILAGHRAADLFKDDPRVSKIWVWNKRAPFRKKLEVLKDLRRQSYDWVVDLRRCLLPWLVRARGRALSPARRTGLHRIEEHLLALKPFGIQTEGLGPVVSIPAAVQDRVDGWMKERGFANGRRLVALGPGARSSTKRYPSRFFGDVADFLQKEMNAELILLGDEEDMPIARDISTSLIRPVWDLAGRTNLQELAALLSRVQCAVTNDSAILHLATAVGTPVVGIFGPTNPAFYRPTGPHDEVVRLDLPCSPCGLAQCPRTDFPRECLEALGPDRVIAAVRRILS